MVGNGDHDALMASGFSTDSGKQVEKTPLREDRREERIRVADLGANSGLNVIEDWRG
jgi:hypothetical protein